MTATLVRNGTAMPINRTHIALDDLGYPGWYVEMRTNPRSSTYDDLISLEDGRWWPAFGKIVLEWNLADEDGQPFPCPAQVESEKELDLPIALITHVFSRYIEAVRTAAALPKGSSDNSSTTSSTSEGSQGSG